MNLEQPPRNAQSALAKTIAEHDARNREAQSPVEYISHVSVQIGTLKTIRHQLEEALNFKVKYSTNVVMQDLKIRGMENHIRAAIEMLPEC